MGETSYRTIHREQHHFGWDNSIAPVMEAAPGDEIEFEVIDASGAQFSPESTAADVAQLDFERVNPVAGPVRIDGAEPGDALEIEVIDFAPSDWGWTAIIPGFGLLADDFTDAYMHISHYDGKRVEFTPDIHLPTRPFTGTIGVAPAEPGRHSVVPPRRVGGNMDLRDVVRGAKLLLPVEVPGALFSVGDTHAAQGDGEVCGTAVETAMNVRLRFGLRKGAGIRRPQIELPGSSVGRADSAGYYITTGIGSDLMQAARDAICDMID
ncbi:MAG: acetamidase/formamidase family protein, partial [Myxococcota bacterium]